VRATILLLIAPLAAVAAPRPGEPGTPEHEKATALVKQLGHPRFAVREAAGKQLVEMGAAAVAALQAGAKADDEEVRARCVALLPQAKAADWKRRAAAYLADTEGQQKHDLPMLADWEKVTGKPDAGTRQLYAEMLRTSGELLDAVAANPKDARTRLAERTALILTRVRTVKGQVEAEAGELAALFFVETWSTEPAKAAGPPRTRDRFSSPAALLSNPGWPKALDAADTGPVLRKLLARWAGTRAPRDYQAHQQFAMLATRKPFPEAVPVLAAAARSKDTDVLSVRAVAVHALGKVGGKEAAAALTDLLGETTEVFQGGPPGEYRLGDMALAGLVQMHGKKPSDFGLNNNLSIGFASGPGEDAVMLSLAGFRNQEDRSKAVQKWKDEAAKLKPDEKKGK